MVSSLYLTTYAGVVGSSVNVKVNWGVDVGIVALCTVSDVNATVSVQRVLAIR